MLYYFSLFINYYMLHKSFPYEAEMFTKIQCNVVVTQDSAKLSVIFWSDMKEGQSLIIEKIRLWGLQKYFWITPYAELKFRKRRFASISKTYCSKFLIDSSPKDFIRIKEKFPKRWIVMKLHWISVKVFFFPYLVMF